MHDERISPAVSRAETPHDRSEDSPRYEALEDARHRGRRHARRGDPPARTRPSQPSTESGVQMPHAQDGVRGTKLDVVG